MFLRSVMLLLGGRLLTSGFLVLISTSCSKLILPSVFADAATVEPRYNEVS